MFSVRAKEGKGIPYDIAEEGGAVKKGPTPMGEPTPSYVAAEPTKEVNIGTEEEPVMIKIGTKMDVDEKKEL